MFSKFRTKCDKCNCNQGGIDSKITELEVSLLSISLSCLTIGLDIGHIQGLIASSLRSFTQAQTSIRIESMLNSFPIRIYR